MLVNSAWYAVLCRTHTDICSAMELLKKYASLLSAPKLTLRQVFSTECKASHCNAGTAQVSALQLTHHHNMQLPMLSCAVAICALVCMLVSPTTYVMLFKLGTDAHTGLSFTSAVTPHEAHSAFS